ncbi:hypothetical protein ABID12_003580 [Martelella mangrovi]|uniref:Uncharacterized protein n=1 Tax=Martelella mangrovi TaxID=1397477 RepID=A0ABV2IFN1_9HYPH
MGKSIFGYAKRLKAASSGGLPPRCKVIVMLMGYLV